MVSITAPLHAGGEIEGPLRKVIDNSCRTTTQASQYNLLNQLIDRLTVKKNWEQSARITVPVICLMEYGSWLSTITYNLTLYGLNEAQPDESTLQSLAYLMSVQTIGKGSYLPYLQIWENLENSGVEFSEIFDFFAEGMRKNQPHSALEILSVYYTRGLVAKLSHEEALKEANKSYAGIKNTYDRKIVLSTLFPEVSAELEQEGLTKTETTEKLEQELVKFWASVRKKVHYKISTFQEVNNVVDRGLLVKHLKSWVGTPYGYKMKSRNGADIPQIFEWVLKKQGVETTLPYSPEHLSSAGKSVSPRSMTAGALLFFSFDKKSPIKLPAIYLGDNEILITTPGTGCVIWNLEENPSLASRLITVRRLIP